MRAVLYLHCLADFSEQAFIANVTKREAIFVQFLAGGALERFVLILSGNRFCHFSFSLLVDCFAWAAV
jgi:hypothetical protein